MERVICVLYWKRPYATRFGSREHPLTLVPGANEITEDNVEAMDRHAKALARLEEAGHLSIEEPTRLSPSKPRDPKKRVANNGGKLEPGPSPGELRIRKLAKKPRDARGNRIDVGAPAPEIDPAEVAAIDELVGDGSGDALPPAWDTGSSYEELKAAAKARGIEFAGNVGKAKLLELLEAHDDADGDDEDSEEDDDEEDDEGGT